MSFAKLSIATLLIVGVAFFMTLQGAAPALPVFDTDPIVKHIRNVSWLINSPESLGSGVMFTRQKNGEGVHFIWTAAHNVASAQQVEYRLDPVKHQPVVIVTYRDIEVMQQEFENNRVVAHHYYITKVLRYSDSTLGQDLALLRLRKKNLCTDSVKFFHGDKPHPPGTIVWHVGSASGYNAPNALSLGNKSLVGLSKGEKVYDQYTIPIRQGCSGGGIFLKSNGECVGLLVEAAMSRFEKGSNTAFTRPSREIIAYAKRTNCLWAVNTSVPVPDDKEIFSTPIEDFPVPMPKLITVP